MSGKNNNAHQEQGAGQEEDDDFGDFGGFEAADPMENMGAAGGQAAAAPWAALASASAGGRHQPDLLCPQNSFPPYLDPSGIAGSPLHSGTDNSDAVGGRPEGDRPLFNAQFADGDHHQGQATERIFLGNGNPPMADVVDGTFNSAATHNRGAGAATYPANGMLPDIGLGTNQNPRFAERPMAVDVSGNAVNAAEVSPALAGADQSGDLENPVAREEDTQPVRVEGGDDVGREGERQAALSMPQDPVVDEAGQSRLQRELASLQSSNLILSQQLQRSQADLADQRSRLQEIQQQHLEQLEAVRQAGHESIALLTEQHQEVCRTAVLAEQETSQRHLVDVTEQQLQIFRRALQAQKEEAEAERQQAQTRIQEELSITLESLRTEQQERFDRHLAEQRDRHEAALRRAVEEQQSLCQRQIQDAVEAEQRRTAEQLEKVKEEQQQKLEDQRRRYEELLLEQCKHERDQAQERLSSCLEEERQRGRDMTDRALQEACVQREAYVEQQRRRDEAVRRRQLTSLDLFLESARRQIDLLLNSDPPPPSPLSASSHPPPSPDNGSKDE